MFPTDKLLALDPSLTCSGWAHFVRGELVACGIVQTKPGQPIGERFSALSRALPDDLLQPGVGVVAEWPEVYTSGEADANKLLALAAVVGAVVGAMNYPSNVTLYKPKEWKGQVPKEIHNARVLKRLSAAEQAVLRGRAIPESLVNNALDAIGIGLFTLGRLGKGAASGAAGADPHPGARTAPNSDKARRKQPRRGRASTFPSRSGYRG